MKKNFIILLILITSFSLISCKDNKNGDKTPEPTPPAEENNGNNENGGNNSNENDESGEEESDVIKLTEGKNEFTLDEELRTKDVSSVQKFELNGQESFRLDLIMGGSYDNPITIKKILVDGVELDLIIDGLPTSAGKHESGTFQLDGRDVEFHRATNYQPLRIKSSPTESGFMILDLTGVETFEIELVFTTSAAGFFETVNLTFE